MVMVQNPAPQRPEVLVHRYPAGVCVMLTFAISWTGALSVRMDVQGLLHSAQCKQDSLEQRFRAGRTARDVDINGNHCIYSAHRCVVGSEDATTDTAGTHGYHGFRMRRCRPGLAQRQFHVARDWTGDQQHVSMTR